MIIDLGHIIVDFDPSAKDGKWKDFNELGKKEGFRLPTLKELRYFYSLKKDLRIGSFPGNWIWSSEPMELDIYSPGPKYYFKDFRNGEEEWDYAHMTSALLVRVYDK